MDSLTRAHIYMDIQKLNRERSTILEDIAMIEIINDLSILVNADDKLTGEAFDNFSDRLSLLNKEIEPKKRRLSEIDSRLDSLRALVR